MKKIVVDLKGNSTICNNSFLDGFRFLPCGEQQDISYTTTYSKTKQEVYTIKHLLKQLGIEKVIFNEKATIVYLTTGEKGVAIRSDTEEFDPVIGLSVAYALAESGTSKKRFKQIIEKEYKRKVKK